MGQVLPLEFRFQQVHPEPHLRARIQPQAPVQVPQEVPVLAQAQALVFRAFPRRALVLVASPFQQQHVAANSQSISRGVNPVGMGENNVPMGAMKDA